MMKKMIAESKTKRRPILHLISDSTGNLLEHFFAAILTQFPKGSFEIHIAPFIKDEKSFREVLKDVRSGVLFHAVVRSELKTLIMEKCMEWNLPCWDVTGPTVEFLERVTGIRASLTPQPIHLFDSSYKTRIEATEFAMQHDDNRRLEELDKAEIILVGLSRVSKSPNSLFLAYRGFRVANVSWDPLVGLPDQLIKHPRKNVVALTIQPRKLTNIRKRRFEKWQLEEFSYDDLPSVIREVMNRKKFTGNKGGL